MPNRWQSLGPAPDIGGLESLTEAVSGRVLSMAFSLDISVHTVIRKGKRHSTVTSHPAMLIGTDGGGIWRSTNFMDPAPDWAPVTDSLAASSMSRQDLLRAMDLPYGPEGPLAVRSIDTFPVSLTGLKATPPRVVYAALSGGLLKSSDSGRTWNLVYINSFAPRTPTLYNLQKVFVDPRDQSGQTVFALGRSAHTVYGYSTGIFKSTNGGATWTTVATVPSGYISDMEYSFREGVLTVYATQLGLRDGQAAMNGIYTIDEASGRWSKIDLKFVDVGSRDVDPAEVSWIALASDRTRDASRGLYALVTDSQQLINVFHLARGASGFVTAGTGLKVFPTQSDSHAIGLSPSGVVYIGGNTLNAQGVWQLTRPDGAWAGIEVGADGSGPHSDLHAWGAFTGADGNEVVFNGNDGGIWRFDPRPGNQPGPGSWSSLNTPGLVTHLDYSLDLNPVGSVDVCVASQDNGLVHMSDFPVWFWAGSGDSFRIRYDRGGANVEQIAYYNAVQAVQGAYEVHIFRQALGSRVAPVDVSAKIPSLDRTYLRYVYPFDVDPARNALFVLGDKLWTSTDRGETWQAVSPSLSSGPLALTWNLIPNTLAVLGKTIWVADSTQVLLTTDTGDLSNHRQIDYQQFGGAITAIAIDPQYSDNVCVGTGNGTFLYSTDAGRSWTDLTFDFPRNLVVNCIALMSNYDDDPSMFVGTPIGVYTLVNVTEFTQSWQPLGTGLPDVSVQELRFYLDLGRQYGNWWLNDDNTNLFAATYGRGIFAIVAS